jgi:hypothetical protein
MEPSLVVTIKRYAKLVVAAAGTATLIANEVIRTPEQDFTSIEGLVRVGIAIAFALGVRQVPNKQD